MCLKTSKTHIWTLTRKLIGQSSFVHGFLKKISGSLYHLFEDLNFYLWNKERNTKRNYGKEANPGVILSTFEKTVNIDCLLFLLIGKLRLWVRVQ